MNYTFDREGIGVATDKKWLKRKGCSKRAIKLYGILITAVDASTKTLSSVLKVQKRTVELALSELASYNIYFKHKTNINTMQVVLGRENVANYKKTLLPSIPNVSGVYLLYKGLDIVYVGKTHNARGRLHQHMREDLKDFDKIELYPIDNKADIAIAEVYLINRYKPRYNKDSKAEEMPTLIIANLDSIVTDMITIPNNARETVPHIQP